MLFMGGGGRAGDELLWEAVDEDTGAGVGD